MAHDEDRPEADSSSVSPDSTTTDSTPAATSGGLTPEDIATLTQNHHELAVVGDALATLQGVVDHHVFDEMTDPEVVTCALLASKADLNDPSILPRPLYLRPPDVTIKECDV